MPPGPIPFPTIQQQLADIEAMQNAFLQPSCEPQEPFVTYPTSDTGTPPTINFDIPQSSAFKTYGYLVQYIDPTCFKAFTLAVPEYNFFDYVKTLTPTAVTQLFHANVAAPAPIVGQFIPSAVSATAVHPGTIGAPVSARPMLAGVNVRAVAQPAPQYVTAMPAPDVTSPIANFAMQGIQGLYTHRFVTGGAVIKYVAQPPRPVPKITILEEYTTESFLGDYGAGRVVKTMSLLPGEKTTISVRTYSDQSSTSANSDNILDSFSDASATQLDNEMQSQYGQADSNTATNSGNDTSYNQYSNSQNSTKSWGISGSVGINLDVISASVGGGYNQSNSSMSSNSGGQSNSYGYSNTGTRASNLNVLNSAINNCVQSSNASRQMNVNTTTVDTADSGEEDVTVRVIQNVNLSRVLNFTWRQLLQQYTTITWLSGLKFAYTNGYPGSYSVVDISALPNMLQDVLSSQQCIDTVMCQLLAPYCNVLDYTDTPQQFIEAITVNVGGCLQQWLPQCSTKTELLWRVNKALQMTYSDDDVNLTVNGVILSVTNQTLYTDSLICDALLGAGEALDCFNQNAQNASNMADYIRNLQAMQRLEDSIQTTANNEDIVTQQQAVVQAILDTPDPVSAASLYKKVFGDCCDVPQNTDCGGCGCA